MKRLLITLFSLSLTITLCAQQLDKTGTAVPDMGFCAHDRIFSLSQQNTAWVQKHQQIEKLCYNYFSKNPAEKTTAPDYVLPVVVHIIHDNGAENIPDATVLQGIEDLNNAYANLDPYDPSDGVDTKIQFCLAKRDPDGNATTGINRVESPLTEMVLENDDIMVKDLSRWDPTKYINIWLVREICSASVGCGVAGYAYFPSSHGNPEDGIMMEANFFGSSPGGSGVQVHEMGHYLGLYHTFQGGCVNNDCLADGDLVCDTPPDQSTAPVPCGGSANSCNTDANSGFPTDQDDLFTDFMDYGDFNCWSVLTQGQADRMAWHIDNVRFSLLESLGCQDPCTSNLTAGFTPDVTTLDVGGTVNFTNTSTNTTTAEWEIDGVPFASTTDADYTFNQVGTYEICLSVGNADPNCSDSFCQTITVTCPVVAEFNTDVFYPNPGEMINYTNASTNATEYSWTVNGVVEATSTDFTYSFPNQGINEVCLVAGNGLCETQFCIPVFVAEGSVNDCDDATFVRVYGEENIDEEGMLIIPSGDGNLYLAGRSGSQTLLIKMDVVGDEIWQRTFQFSTQLDIISDLIVDSDGNLIGCGFGEDGVNADFDPFVFKYDPVADDVLWVRQYSGESRSFNIFEPTPGSDYIVTMDLRNSPSPGAFEDAILREIDRNTGLQTGNLATNYNIGSSETFSAAIISNGDIFTTGRYTNGAGVTNMRHSISRFSLDGTEQWTRFSHVSTAGLARLYGRDILEENGFLYTTSSGDDDGGSATVTNFFLQKNDLNGGLIWTRKYDIPQYQNEWVEELVSTTDGFLLYGHDRQSPGDLFIVKVDKDGNPIWAKTYGEAGNENLRFTPQSQILNVGPFIYFTAWTDSYSNSRDLLLVKADSEGNLEDDCLLVNEIEIGYINVLNPANTFFSLTDYNNSQAQIAGDADPLMSNVPFGEVDGCACEVVFECDTTFLKTYGTPTLDENSHAISPVPASLGGGFMLGGGQGEEAMLTWLDPIGDIIWTRSFDATFNAADFVWDIKFDSENNVIGVGQTRDEPLDNIECFAFRYDMVSNNIMWINELDLFDPAQEVYYSILEKSPGGNFVVSGRVDQLAGGNGAECIMVEINRNTGNNVWQRNLHAGPNDNYSRSILANGSIFATGTFDGGSNDLRRPGITRLDLNGNQIWSKWYLDGLNAGDLSNLEGWDIIQDNGLVVLGHGTYLDAMYIFLFNTDYDGNLQWARSYEIPGATEIRTTRVLNLPDGYVCLGYHDSGDRDAFIFKTDKDGDLEWAQSYGSPDGDETAWDMVWEGGQVYFTGETDVPTNGLSEDAFLSNVNPDGTTNAQDSCNLFSDLNLQEDNWPELIEFQMNLSNESPQWGSFLDFATMNETSVQSTVECFNPCIDSCDIVPEALIVGADGSCMGLELATSIEVCNDGNFELPAGTSITFYDGDPTTTNASVVGTYTLPEEVGHNECKVFDFNIPGVPNTTYYVLVNDDGTTPTPFDLSTFSGSGEEECDYTNNLGSFQVEHVIPPLDLGPDTFMCENGVVDLDAGPDFATYEWNDGSMMQTLTAWLPGTYWVKVTDVCGNELTDSILIEVDSMMVLDLGPDVEVCEGGSFDLEVPGYETYEWSPADYLSCTDCPNPTVTLEGDITYTLVATNAAGCIGVDSISFTQIPGFMTSEEITICDGETVDIFGEPIGDAGVYEMTFQATNGCDSTHTVTLSVLDNVFSEEDIFICFGETADIFGEAIGEAGVYEMTFDAANGCDSTHTITLEVNPELFLDLTATDVSCFEGMDGSATANASGGTGDFTYVWENGDEGPERMNLVAGTYTVTATDANGCSIVDSIEVMQPTEVTVDIIGVNVACDELGAATATANGGTGDYTYEWSNDETGPEITGLEAGIYSVTATDANGCTGAATVEITGGLGPDVAITVNSLPSNDNPNGGSLSAEITGGTEPFNIEWNSGQDMLDIDGLGSGEYIILITDANGCTATDTAYLYIGGCIGDLVWEDIDRDGCRDGGEQGFEAVELTLTGTDIWGNPYTATLSTGFLGEYSFEGLPPGDYVVTMDTPVGYLNSPQDAGCQSENFDSDFASDGTTSTITLSEGECITNIDGGIYDECLNVTFPGEICCDQVLCGPGNIPAPITPIVPATGASQIEYMWMYSVTGTGIFMLIPNSNTASYQPGPLDVTTTFVRCTRAVGCGTWLETNTVTITVIQDPADCDDQSFQINWPGISSTAADSYRLFPNPTTGDVTLIWDANKEGELLIELRDINGRLYRSEQSEAGAGVYETDISALPAGVYFFRLLLPDGSAEMLRLVKD